MKGCTSYEIVRRMAQGMTPQQAADSVVFELEDKLMSRFGRAGDLSVVCMNSKGEFGAATNIKTFSFVVATARQPLTVFRTERLREKTHYHAVDEGGCRPMPRGSAHRLRSHDDHIPVYQRAFRREAAKAI